MQYEQHPNYRPVVFMDSSCDKRFVVGSCVETSKTIEHEGETMPLVLVDISSASHQVYTGERRTAAAEGQVSKFQRKFNLKIASGKQ